MRVQKNLEHQIRAKNMTGVADETLKEFNAMFKCVSQYEQKNFGLLLNRALELEYKIKDSVVKTTRWLHGRLIDFILC